MTTTRLTLLVQDLSAASLRVDATADQYRAAKRYLPKSGWAPYQRDFHLALEVEGAARLAATAEYNLRHDLHVAEDGCPLCGARQYDLHSDQATDAERRWAAGFSEDAARMLGVTA